MDSIIAESLNAGAVRQRKKRGKPDEIDAHVGRRIRERRLAVRMSQQHLAESIEVTFQQIQKYENGSNKAGAGRLYALSIALDVPISYFFDDAPMVGRVKTTTEALAARDHAALAPDSNRRLIASYYRVENTRIRLSLLALAKSLAGQSDDPDPE